MHPLRRYLHDQKITATALAKRLGVLPSTVSRWMNGERIPEPDQMDKIHAETGLTANDFYAYARRRPAPSLPTGALG